MFDVFCGYCKKKAELVKGDRIYPDLIKLHNKWYYLCVPCKAYVGCHDSTKRPFGTLAKKPLRIKRMDTHEAFDSIWLSRKMSRSAAYHKLAEAMGIPVKLCHIGCFDIEQCNKVIEIVNEWKNPKLIIPDEKKARFELAFNQNSHEVWDEESGPRKVLNFGEFCAAVEDLVKWKKERKKS